MHGLSTGDRVAYGIVVTLALLAGVPSLFRPERPPEEKARAQRDLALERLAEGVLLGSAVLVFLGWEAAKAWRRTVVTAADAVVSEETGVEGKPLLVLIVSVILPAGLPIAMLGAWAAGRLTDGLPDHPLIPRAIPVRVSAFVTTYAVTILAAILWLLLRKKRS